MIYTVHYKLFKSLLVFEKQHTTMGVKGLPTLINDIAGKSAVGEFKFKRFEGFKVAVDTSLLIHQTVIAIRGNGRDMKNSKGEMTSQLHAIFYKTLTFLENQMVPIYVLDGKAPDIKKKTTDVRKEKKTKASKKLETMEDSEDEEYIKTFKQSFSITKADIKEVQILLDLMGVPYINAPAEADVVCAWLASRTDVDGKRYVKGVCSDDSDMLALGAPYLFKNMLKNMNKNKPITVISLKKSLVKMNITMDQFYNLCPLLGTDFCDKIKGIGPKNAYLLIKKYGSLEKIFKHIHRSDSDDSAGSTDSTDSDTDDQQTAQAKNEKCLILSRDYYRDSVDELDESDDFVITDDSLELRRFQFEELMDFMCVKHGFDIMRITTGIERLKKYYKIMDVYRENTKNVHTIIQPRSENYLIRALTEDLDFISSDEEEEMPSKKKKAKSIRI